MQLMKCRVYCKHETFVSSQIGIKIVINKCNIVNSLFIAFKFEWVSDFQGVLRTLYILVSRYKSRIFSFYQDG